jgi:acetylornithine deacetylase/succinyl-diaminopimelate desuccinylase-like protein
MLSSNQTRKRWAVRWSALLIFMGLTVGGALVAPTDDAWARQSATSVTGAPPILSQEQLNQLFGEAQVWLADLIHIDTTNPPGNELAAAKYVAAVLQKENIPVEIVEIAPGRGVAIAQLQAGPLRDPSKALLLVAHLDVVGVDKSKWTVDPFGATAKDGYLWGRGAIDDKGMLAANLAIMVELKRAGVHLNRDVIFLADDDEEQGGSASIKLVIDKYWDKIACAFAINEGGRVVLKDGKVQYVGVQASEKVPYNVAVIATGASGHASVPRPDNSVVHLAAAIQKLGTMETPVQLMTVTRRYFEQLAQIEDEDTAKWMRALETPERFELAARRLSDMSPVWNSMLRDSIAPTELRAGVRGNVVPSESWANLNIRLLPGDPISGVIAQMQKAVNDPQIKFEIEPDSGQAAPPSSLTSELYKAIEHSVSQQFPGTPAVPFLSTGATDSAELRLHSVQSYGLLPFPLTEADELRMHADDERIPLSSFRTGIEFLYRTVHDFVAK